MSRKNLYLTGLLGLLLLLILLPRVIPEGRDYPAQLGEVDTAAVSRVWIAQGRDSIMLERREGVWQVGGDQAWRADDRAVQAMLASLANLDVAALANANDNLLADDRYGLGDAAATRLKIWEGERLALAARVGRASQDYQGSFARREEDLAIYRLTREVGGRLSVLPGRWLDKLAFRASSDSVVAIELERSDGRLAFARGDTAWSVSWQPLRGQGWHGARGSETTLPGLLAALSNLRLSDLPTPAQREALRAAPAVLSHHLTLADGGRHTFQWARLDSEENLVFLRREGEDHWFAMYAALLDRLLEAPSAYRQSP
ncbi:MAG: DUF4340 domain-containing protein [bacterium]|jgi:hypothetical protein|nr:DUF4340 domain-containing protein [bacterium]